MRSSPPYPGRDGRQERDPSVLFVDEFDHGLHFPVLSRRDHALRLVHHVVGKVFIPNDLPEISDHISALHGKTCIPNCFFPDTDPAGTNIFLYFAPCPASHVRQILIKSHASLSRKDQDRPLLILCKDSTEILYIHLLIHVQ